MARYSIPSQIVIGSKVLDEAAESFLAYGKKALIVTGKHVVKSNAMTKLKEVLSKAGIQYTVFDGITGEPTDTMIEDGVLMYQKKQCDFCIGIGGGSPLDSAKAIAAMAVNPGKITDYNGKLLIHNPPAIVAIPTTAGTGSEATKFTIITDTTHDIKMLLKKDSLVPTLAIIDFRFGMTAPKTVTAATGLDALTHVIEAFTSKKAFSMTDTLAISAVKRIMKYLPIAYKNGADEKAREEMAIAALEGGICINNSSVTLVHGMSRPIGALFHVAHGLSNAMLLKECLSFALEGAYERFAVLGRAIGAATDLDDDQTASEKFLEAVENLCVICQVPTLKEYGISEDAFFQNIEKMAKDAIDSGSPGNTRKKVTVGDCVEIYKKVYA